MCIRLSIHNLCLFLHLEASPPGPQYHHRCTRSHRTQVPGEGIFDNVAENMPTVHILSGQNYNADLTILDVIVNLFPDLLHLTHAHLGRSKNGSSNRSFES